MFGIDIPNVVEKELCCGYGDYHDQSVFKENIYQYTSRNIVHYYNVFQFHGIRNSFRKDWCKKEDGIRIF